MKLDCKLFSYLGSVVWPGCRGLFPSLARLDKSQ